MITRHLLTATLVVLAIAGGSVATGVSPAQAAAQVSNPCERLSKGQTKFSGFGANRVTFATAAHRDSNVLTITGCVRSRSGYIQEWQDWGYGGLKGFSPQNKAWENTYRTPTGSFSFTEALGRRNPGTALKYYTVNPRSRWGGERGRTYNQYFQGVGGPSDENLYTYMNQGYYEQAAVINYNRLPDARTVQGASFAIFFHAGRVPSAGCVSTSLSTVNRLLRSSRPGDRIIMGAVDDVFTPYSSSPFGAITAKYARSGGPAGLLGIPAGNEAGRLIRGGAQQAFRNGAIVWSPATGARTSIGIIRSTWIRAGGQNGALGYPTTDNFGGLRNGGVQQSFQGGAIVWTRGTGAHATSGAIRSSWLRAGAQNGSYGYPVSDELRGLKNGGKSQTFQGGSIHWSPASGAHATSGAIRTKWLATGSEKGRLGYPTGPRTALAQGGVYQKFQGGAIYWSAATGAHISAGGIRSAWSLRGYENGPLGYPVTDEIRVAGGSMQSFQGGAVYWSAVTAGRSLVGGISTKFTAAGGVAVLGFPTAEQTVLTDGGVVQTFQNGTLVAAPAKGFFLTSGKIRDAWAAQGAERGPLGYPSSDMTHAAEGAEQKFTGGSIRLGADGVARTNFPAATEPATSAAP